MTDDQLAEIEARLAASTPGPWDERSFDSLVRQEDRALATHAPTDMRALVTEVKELEQYRKRALTAEADVRSLRDRVADKDVRIGRLLQRGTSPSAPGELP